MQRNAEVGLFTKPSILLFCSDYILADETQYDLKGNDISFNFKKIKVTELLR
jgi:hypothetical protein